MSTEDVITEAGQVPDRVNTMANSYCRLNPISCGPVTTDVDTNYYKVSEADERCNVSAYPWAIA